jgi:DNA-directed RNA polymerase specialized sigma24 family protein
MGRRGVGLDELEALYRGRFEVFERLAAGVMGDSERARDVVQEAFATAVRKRRSFRREGPLEAWVWRIVLNAARSEARPATSTHRGSRSSRTSPTAKSPAQFAHSVVAR